MNELLKWILTPIEVVVFVVFISILCISGFVVIPYYFLKELKDEQ